MCKIQPRLYLISSSDSNRFKHCKGKPNHTTYGHSRSPTWQPFTSSHPKSSPLHPYSRACPHLIAHGCEPAAFGLTTLLALMRGGSSSTEYRGSNSEILQVTSVYRAHKHGMRLVRSIADQGHATNEP